MKIEVEIQVKSGTQQLGLMWIAGRVEAALKKEMETEGSLLHSFGPVSIVETIYQQPIVNLKDMSATEATEKFVKPLADMIDAALEAKCNCDWYGNGEGWENCPVHKKKGE